MALTTNPAFFSQIFVPNLVIFPFFQIIISIKMTLPLIQWNWNKKPECFHSVMTTVNRNSKSSLNKSTRPRFFPAFKYFGIHSPKCDEFVYVKCAVTQLYILVQFIDLIISNRLVETEMRVSGFWSSWMKKYAEDVALKFQCDERKYNNYSDIIPAER